MDRNIVLNYTSTLDGSVLMLTCENDTSRLTHEQINIATCHSSGKWIPDPTQFTCSSLTSVPPGAETTHHPPHSSGSNNVHAPISYKLYSLTTIDNIEFISQLSCTDSENCSTFSSL